MSNKWSFRMKLERGMTLTANQRLSWRAANRVTRELRNRALIYARGSNFPRDLSKVRIHITLHWHDPGRRRDAANWSPTAKAIVDGLVDFGLIPDDSNKFLEGPFLWAGGEVAPPGVTWVDVVVTDMSPSSVNEGGR
ncbi:MAG: hypothetical protein MSC45_03120 [Mobiluncus sp.]|uniref:hypothetical protein n=1 Tax=Mobiluncus sp. TaxID=47293 RepID=UPI00258773B5|nr:hypothetical protein [Mobiluncus sp.]MCI6584048.1 hypothetical protein [Mobiluncus sp.]